MVAERLTFEEMSRLYDGEYLLVGEPEMDEEYNPVSGIVLAHSKDQEEVYSVGKDLDIAYAAYWSFVPWPTDVVVIL